jgi:hypothetical protein
MKSHKRRLKKVEREQKEIEFAQTIINHLSGTTDKDNLNRQ